MRLKNEIRKVNITNVEGLGMLRNINIVCSVLLARWTSPVDLKKTKYQSYQNYYQFNVTEW